MKSFTVGTVRGYVNPPEFENAGIKKEEVTTDEQNLKKLNGKRIQFALLDKSMAQYLTKTKFPKFADVLEWIKPVLKKEDIHLGFSKKVPDYQQKLKDFNSGLKAVQDDGTVENILKKYGITE